MADVTLKISLQDRDLDQLREKLKNIGRASPNKVDLDVKDAINKAQDLRTQLRDVGLATSQLKSPALSTVATGAKQAAAEVRSLFTELKEVQIAAGRTTDPKIFQSLQNRAIEIEKDLDRIGTKLDRVASGRMSTSGIAAPSAPGDPASTEKAATAITKLGSASANALKLNSFQMTNLSYQINDVATMLAMGASPFQIIASQGGQIYQIFGSVNQMLAFTQAALAKVGLSLTGLGAIAGVAAIGYGIVEWSKSVRAEAERRLAVEEAIAGAINRQLLLGKQILADQKVDEERQLAAQQFSRFLNKGTLGDLQRRYGELKRIQDIGGNTDIRAGKDGKFEVVESDRSKQRREEMLALQKQMDTLKNSDKTSVFFQASELWKKERDAIRKAEEDRFESVAKGVKKAEEAGKAWVSMFDSMTRGSDNPFTKIFLNARTELEKLKESIKGLPNDLQKAAVEGQKAFNARQLFSQRVDTALSVFGLRETARRFRDDTAERKALADTNYSRDFAEFERRLALGGINEQANRDYFEQRRRMMDQIYRGDTPADKLDRQLESLRGLSPANDAQRAILDRSILGFAGNLDPSQLRGDQREQIASIAERSAERQIRQEMEALNEMRRHTELLERIERATDELKKSAAAGGLAGVEKALKVTIADETGGGISVSRNPARPSNASTVRDFHLDVVSGGSGLTNR